MQCWQVESGKNAALRSIEGRKVCYEERAKTLRQGGCDRRREGQLVSEVDLFLDVVKTAGLYTIMDMLHINQSTMQFQAYTSQSSEHESCHKISATSVHLPCHFNRTHPAPLSPHSTFRCQPLFAPFTLSVIAVVPALSFKTQNEEQTTYLPTFSSTRSHKISQHSFLLSSFLPPRLLLKETPKMTVPALRQVVLSEPGSRTARNRGTHALFSEGRSE